MNGFSFLLSGLRQHARLHAAVCLGVMAATAVLTGALLVGDSVRGSLRDLALEGLGRIDYAVASPHFFRAALAEEFASTEAVKNAGYEVIPGVFLQGNLKARESERLATQVQVLGVPEDFWQRAGNIAKRVIAPGDVILNTPLAEELNAKVGDHVILRLPTADRIPPDSPLGRKVDTLRRVELTVSAIIPAEGLARFTLFPAQQAPRNAFVNVTSLQGRNRPAGPGEVNALYLVKADKATADAPSDATFAQLNAAFAPRLQDYGLELKPVQYELGDETITRAVQLTSKRMLLEPEIQNASLAAWRNDGAVPVFTYLANTIASGGASIPYSTITAVDSTELLGPAWMDRAGQSIGPLAEDEIVLNDWALEQLKLNGTPGAEVTISYFEPETTHGEAQERTATFRLKAVVALTPPAAPARRGELVRFASAPTPATDAEWTPEVEGITDKDMRDWDAPFPYDQSRLRAVDDDYWNEYHTTPKAFISLAAGRKLWGSRFGQATSIRLPYEPGVTLDALAGQVKIEPGRLGMGLQPVRAQALLAARGTTQFEQLFLGFSFFIITAAMLLTAILVRLGLEQRASEIGVLLASGWRLKRVRRLFWMEGAVLSLIGGALGVALGIGYCQLMLAALTSPRWWLGAIGVPFLKLHVAPTTLAIGFISGALISMGVIALALRQLRGVSVRQLLGGEFASARSIRTHRVIWSRLAAGAALAAAVAAVASARSLSGDAQAGAFFGGGALVLTAFLIALWGELRREPSASVQGWSLRRLAARNAARQPGRSTLTISLVASAAFLIMALSAFRLNPAEEFGRATSGSGGFALIAESDQPIFADLNNADARAELGLPADLDARLADSQIFALRVQDGDDASCLNLYQTHKPRVLGAPARFIQHGGFAWAASVATSEAEKQNPWLLLDRKFSGADETVVPVVVDQATALYSLHLSGIGARYTMQDGRGQPLTLEVVGLLKNSVLQGSLIVSERQLIQHFPDAAGYRMFLIEVPGARAPHALEKLASGRDPAVEFAAELEAALGDYGFDAVRTRDRLEALMSIQNTYLATFQSLGGLGLLLGTFGLAAVQLRNIFERRGELALLRAEGFATRRLSALVMLENAALLFGGLAIGGLAALVVVAPHWISGGAAPPWVSLLATLGAVAVVGGLVSLLAVQAMLKSPILPALRGE